VSHNYTLRPTMLNEFRFGLSNNDPGNFAAPM
jgi:hypothetical protein